MALAALTGAAVCNSELFWLALKSIDSGIVVTTFVVAQAAVALHNIGHKKTAVQALVKELDGNLSITNEAMVINTMMQIRETKAIPKVWYDKWLSADTGILRLGTLAKNVSIFND